MRAPVAFVIALAGCAYDRPSVDVAVDGAAGEIDAALLDDADVDTPPSLACDRDDACASQLCERGGCVATDDVRYVATTGTATAPCTQDAPCTTIARARTLSPLLRARIVVGAGEYREAVRISTGELTIVGAGPFPPRVVATSEAAIDLRGGTVTLRNLQLATTGGQAAPGLSCNRATAVLERVFARGATGDGIDSKECTLSLVDSQLVSNQRLGLQVSGGNVAIYSSTIHANGQGGVLVEEADECTLVGSLVDNNGSLAASVGGASVDCQAIRIENVTFARNLLPAGGGPSNLVCLGTSQTRLVRNVIFASDPPQLTGCPVTYSFFEGNAVPAGMGNLFGMGAGFVDATGGDFHLRPTSVARGAADPATTEERDLDGELRPLGLWDIGADEVP